MSAMNVRIKSVSNIFSIADKIVANMAACCNLPYPLIPYYDKNQMPR